MGDYKKFGGEWTEKKLRVLGKYIRAYLTIMKGNKKKYGWRTVYIDGFAGFGKSETINKEDYCLIPFDDVKTKTYEGSVFRVLNITKSEPDLFFDRYVFIDKNREYINKINELINKENLDVKEAKIYTIEGDANEALMVILKDLENTKLRGFLYLDPFGISVDWDMMKKLEKTKVDLWILIPSGQAISRLLPRKGLTREIKSLEKFFGLTKQEILNEFYTEKKHATLFNKEHVITQRIEDVNSKIISLYQRKLKSIGYLVSNALALKNSKNSTIYHFMAASKNDVAIKIADDIIRKEKEERQDGLF